MDYVMADDKTALLRSLSLGASARDDAPERTRTPWAMLALGMLGGVLIAGPLVWVLAPDKSPFSKKAPSTSAGQADAKAPSPGPSAPSATARPAGDLIASGYVVARRRATVAAEITGRVIDVRVEEGLSVQRGQVLAVLDSSLARTELATARSRADSAVASTRALKADIEDARRIYNRTRELASKGYSSNADLTRNQTRVASLEAQLARADADVTTARSDVQRIEVQLSKYEIRAPFSGIVVDKNAQPGEIISPVSAGGGFTRTGICTLVDMNSLEIEVDVNEAFIGRVREGQKVDAVLDAYPDVTFPARVIATVPTANREKATVRVRVGFIGRDARILPDMAIKVTFLEEQA
jgi:HlyD family secretion protein